MALHSAPHMCITVVLLTVDETKRRNGPRATVSKAGQSNTLEKLHPKLEQVHLVGGHMIQVPIWVILGGQKPAKRGDMGGSGVQKCHGCNRWLWAQRDLHIT